jgi:hypothetical protein
MEISVSKRGVTRYIRNPFIGNAISNSKPGVKRISNGSNKMMVISEVTGEVVAPAGFWQAQEVDRTQFVKLYINGVKAFSDLSNAGTKVFAVLYSRVQENIGKDIISMSFPRIDQSMNPMARATFNRGMTELIGKGFIAETVISGDYFLNPDYMWNGDRLSFVKTYTVKNVNKRVDPFISIE